MRLSEKEGRKKAFTFETSKLRLILILELENLLRWTKKKHPKNAAPFF